MKQILLYLLNIKLICYFHQGVEGELRAVVVFAGTAADIRGQGSASITERSRTRQQTSQRHSVRRALLQEGAHRP